MNPVLAGAGLQMGIFLCLIQNQILSSTSVPHLTMQAVVFRLDDASATAQQVEDQHYHRNHKQKVNQRAADAADHPQQPQDQQNN
jgi:hypothetical protein